MTAIAPAPYQPDVAIPPGETIREMLNAASMPQAELAQRMGRPANKLNEIVKGKRQITADTALELELALGLPASFWLNLEKNYQLIKARLAQDQLLEKESHFLASFPVKEMCKFNWIKKCDDIIAQTRELLSFFGITSFEQLKQIKALAPAWRKAQHKEACEYALATWLWQGTRSAQQITTSAFDPKGLRSQLDTIRSFTRQDPEEFEPTLTKLCAGHGVAVVFVRHLPKSYVGGAAYWLNDRAVIQLSVRGKWADIFWFNFFHELGHVLLHLKSRKRMFLDDKNFSTTSKVEDLEANQFAANTLISEEDYESLLRRSYTRTEVVRQFADEIGIAPGIVVGRLQHEIPALHRSPLNALRIQYDLDD
jgi:HTH-type transcriptional regulator / antitoxin HigA